jgi:hypothetical protein
MCSSHIQKVLGFHIPANYETVPCRLLSAGKSSGKRVVTKQTVSPPVVIKSESGANSKPVVAVKSEYSSCAVANTVASASAVRIKAEAADKEKDGRRTHSEYIDDLPLHW